MLCIITLLKEDAVKFSTMWYDIISKEEYKYCTNLTLVSPFPFTVTDLINLKFPLVIRYTSTDGVTKMLYNSKNILEVSTVLEKPKSVNWKQQYQRHQTSKLLQITGD